jgi:hypothetical protein
MGEINARTGGWVTQRVPHAIDIARAAWDIRARNGRYRLPETQ